MITNQRFKNHFKKYTQAIHIFKKKIDINKKKKTKHVSVT